jgi:glutamine synthetase
MRRPASAGVVGQPDGDQSLPAPAPCADLKAVPPSTKVTRLPAAAANLIADPEEARRFLAAHPEIEFFEVIFTALSGVPRGKRLRRSEIMAVFEYGRFLPGSILVCDITGQDCEDTGLVWADGDADRLAKPVPGTLVPAPWLGADVAQVLTSMYELDGTANDIDPRHVLRRVIDRFAADGLTPVVACELEYYLVDGHRTASGGVELAPSESTGEIPTQHGVYGLRELQDAAGFLRELWTSADAQGVPLEGAIAEYAPGQYELTLKHGPDALRAADEAVMYKRIAKGVASICGCEATFMAKPFADRAGNGLHLHVSVNDAAGNNIFASEDPAGTPALRHAIGGMRATLADGMAIFAPNANSYRRFRANSYAPVAPTWGVNNRTVSLRVPAGPPGGRHVEHRVAGADANPYLALAALLAGVHHGLTGKIDPGPPVVGDGYAEAAKSELRLPANWFAAVDAFEASAVMRDYLGARFVEMFTSVKRTEQDRFFGVVTALDYDWYLKNA